MRCNNTRLELTNDATYIVTSKYSDFCLKCGKKLDKREYGNFCDDHCRREFYNEIWKDIVAIHR